MSLVGNFSFNNYDQTASTGGIGSQERTAYVRPQGEPAHHDKDGQHQRNRSLSGGAGRQPSTTERSTRAQDPTPDADPEKLEPAEDSSAQAKEVQLVAKGAEESEDDKRERAVTGLAKQLTAQSTYSDIADNPYAPEKDSVLDPHSPNFRARAWVKAMLRLQAEAQYELPQRTAGLAFRNLNVYGYGASTDYQKSVGNIWFEAIGLVRKVLGVGRRRIDILRDFEGIVRSGEMLVVLGPPGSGCSTFLKTIAGETDGFVVDGKSYLNYQGISAKQMNKDFRGEAIYTAEVDVHFPMLSVGDTLTFAARARAPRKPPGGVTRNVFADNVRDAVMAIFGISHTVNTRVGNDFVRGVSGGERKRVTIAEAALSGAPLQCWDNSTRGLDSANALEFCKSLRMSTQMIGSTSCVSIYQAPQSAYDYFDKAIVLYEGRQIFFGHASQAKEYFIRMGFNCPDRQTTADFLTSMTSPAERIVRSGFEGKVPRTPDEFAEAWKRSEEREQLLRELEEYDREFEIGGKHLQRFIESRRAQQAKHQRVTSPFTLSYSQQVRLCLWRGFQRLRGDPSLTITQLVGNTVMAVIIGSVFFNLPQTTQSFYARGALLFFAILLNAFGSALEILTLYAQRPIVEKHARYAFYHPSAEALASMLTDMPYKVVNAITFNLTLYFMTNLRREAGAFFFFILISFFCTLTMSMFFRTIASLSRTLAQAMAPAAILILALVIYTGFAIPTRYMLGWSRWINYIDPIAYGFECLMINEFHNRSFECVNFVPSGSGYESVSIANRVCGTVGSREGAEVVDGDAFINSSFEYYHRNKWRNFGILIAFLIFLMSVYLVAAEYVSAKKSKGEVLVFRRRHASAAHRREAKNDVEHASEGNQVVAAEKLHPQESVHLAKQTSVFHWKNVCMDIKIKGETRRILDHVDGWVKPGTLTALMGVSGAGKTTLLDVLAARATIGVISGEMLVDGQQRDTSFQRKTGYVQQQDLHLATSTVREALNFSALLRQPASIPRKEKVAYVQEVIKMLDMQEYAEAVVGVPGEGLNVEQRKRLTIAVELAAKPELLLFLDEPTSGLDSQTAWAICDLMQKLTNSGQAILCTIHQPSAMLFQRFDRLVLLESGGRTLYFGEIGNSSATVINYFEKNGAPPCPEQANPAEWMLEVTGAAPGSHTDIDWHNTWRSSPEYEEVHRELDSLKERKKLEPTTSRNDDRTYYREFAATFVEQLWEVTLRVFQQYWRTPSYIYSKAALCIFSALFIGFSFFRAQNSMQGLQNQMFSIFMLMTIFGQLIQQIMPHFVTQRALYEARERPSKAYSWKAFMIANIFVEIPWNTLMAVFIYFCWYYPVGLYRNAEPTDAVTERGGLMFLLILMFLLFTSTFASLCIAGVETAEAGGNLANLAFSLTLVFCGVLVSPQALPGFWIFMYRLSPFTYLISAILSTAVANTDVVCADNEFLRMNPIDGLTCSEYLEQYIDSTGGYLQNPDATSDCSFCPQSSTNIFLASVSADFSDAWRNFGIMWAYVVFNVAGALLIYWLARVPKDKKPKDE